MQKKTLLFQIHGDNLKTQKKRTSIKDIAEKVGVSVSLVSYVLNGKGKEHRVSDEMVEKVLQAAQELHYRPNMAARSLRTGKTKTLGLVVADISNPFFAKLARRIENIAWEKDYQVIFGSSDESKDKFEKLTSVFIEKQVDGMIVTPAADCGDAVMQFVHRNIPIVMLDRHIDGIPVSSVQADNVAAGYALTSYLLRKGRKRIAFLAYNMKLSNIRGRYEGYRKALCDAGMSASDEILQSVEFENFEKGVTAALKEISVREADAIVFATNRIAAQSLSVLPKIEGLPKNLLLTGVDHPEFRMSDMPVYYVEQPIEEMGEKALELLFEQIKGVKKQVPELITLSADWEKFLLLQEKEYHKI